MTYGKVRDWRDDIKVGDVLRVDKRFRLVRRVSRAKDGFLGSVTFAIKRCSWTRRPYTVVGRVDLAYRNFQPTNVRITAEKTPLSERLLREINSDGPPSMTCCEVAGLP